jgi:hypothetical protein
LLCKPQVDVIAARGMLMWFSFCLKIRLSRSVGKGKASGQCFAGSVASYF